MFSHSTRERRSPEVWEITTLHINFTYELAYRNK